MTINQLVERPLYELLTFTRFKKQHGNESNV